MNAHDALCYEANGIQPDVYFCICEPLVKVMLREQKDEQAQREALARLLLDSGDITPMGARLLAQPRRGGDKR